MGGTVARAPMGTQGGRGFIHIGWIIIVVVPRATGRKARQQSDHCKTRFHAGCPHPPFFSFHAMRRYDNARVENDSLP
ncbi:hypothetical protein Gain_0021_045 [Komagataeibacter intermedius TF2]|nr:hypothetical protein Gain_0021_045 [Komagataeibacter intermedius TF2]